jgi:hypothetical protein
MLRRSHELTRQPRNDRPQEVEPPCRTSRSRALAALAALRDPFGPLNRRALGFKRRQSEGWLGPSVATSRPIRASFGTLTYVGNLRPGRARTRSPSEARPGRDAVVGASLDDLRGPARGTVELPLHLFWSSRDRTFDRV